MREIIRNRAKCLLCGDIIESIHRNDFRSCSCKNLHVDGGTDYIRRGFRNGKESYQDMTEYMPYNWDNGVMSTDGHAWCMGVDLLRCPKTALNENVTLPIQLPFVKAPISVCCSIYSVPASLFELNPPIKHLYIAICQYKHSTILFRDTKSFQMIQDHLNQLKQKE